MLEFNQSQWLKPYIELNTQRRIEVKKKKEKLRNRWKNVVQINEQCYIWKNNKKFNKQNQCKTSKQRKRLFKMYKMYLN